MTFKFGTDGVRGVANVDLTAELVLALGRAAARVLGDERFLVGRDTRQSGPLLQAAFSAGVAAEGVSVVDVGVLPTPGVAHLSKLRGAPAAMISASHNPFLDNGIKLFDTEGRKLDDDIEGQVEAELAACLDRGPTPGPTDVGRLTVDALAVDAYVAHLLAALGERRLDGMTIVLDCANGAASEIAPHVFSALGADVRILFNRPDGTNINDGCGSTHPEALQEAVLEEGAVAGLAFDGDADRVLAVDEAGGLVDGDHLLALFARDLKDQGRLAADSVVVTVMTNLGFRLAMAEAGVEVVETQVGDRYVLAALEAGGLTLGGEQSGHLIFRDLATTGDGILTSILLLDLVARRRRPLGELSSEAMEQLPQALRSVRVGDPAGLDDAAAVWAEVRRIEDELGTRGRVLLRRSGTEPLVRVMAEAGTHAAAEAAVAHLCEVVTAALGPPEPS